MKGAVILVGVILLFHNILVTAWRTFVINDATEQVWEVVSESPNVRKLDLSNQNTPYRIPFEANRTFILLKIQHPQWSIFYWLGSQTTNEQKMYTASLAGYMWYEIVKYLDQELMHSLNESQFTKGLWYTSNFTSKTYIINPLDSSSKKKKSRFLVPNSPKERTIPTINREIEHKESLFFIASFQQYGENLGYREEKILPDLYQIGFKNDKIFIDLVPLNLKRNENNYLYVLDEENSIKFSEVRSASDHENAKKLLVYHLINEKLSYGITIDYNTSINESILMYVGNSKMVGLGKRQTPWYNLKMTKFYDTEFKSYLVSNLHIPPKQNTHENNLSGSPYPENENFYIVSLLRQISDVEEANAFYKVMHQELGVYFVQQVENMTMRQITEDLEIVLIVENYYARTIFVYIGNAAEDDYIRYALMYTEIIYRTKMCFEKIRFVADTSVFTLDQNLRQPIAFWVQFPEYVDEFLRSQRSTDEVSNQSLLGLDYYANYQR